MVLQASDEPVPHAYRRNKIKIESTRIVYKCSNSRVYKKKEKEKKKQEISGPFKFVRLWKLWMTLFAFMNSVLVIDNDNLNKFGRFRLHLTTSVSKNFSKRVLICKRHLLA